VRLAPPPPEPVPSETRLRDQSEELPRMGFFEHLEEFRRRLIVSLIALAAAVGVAWSKAP